MGSVPDARLVGYWTDKNLYLGGMEASDIAFRADGTGWVYWYNAAGGFEVLRFSWQAAGQDLTVSLHEVVSGTWSLDGGAVTHRANSQVGSDEQIALAYEITAGRDAIGKPATLLEFDKPVILGVTANRFALERELALDEQDPARSPCE